MFTCSCPYDTSAAEQGRDPLSDPTRLACLRLPAQVLADRGQRAMRGNEAHIDGTAALKRHRVWLYSGSDDPVVFPSVVDGAQAFFRAAGVPAARIQRVSGPRAGHGMPLPGNRNCHVTAPPFLNGCNIDGAGQLLRWIHDERAATAPTPGEAQPSGLQPFDQGPYRQAGVYDGLDDSGWLYVPAACASGRQRCGLHVAFHGCEQGQSFPMGPAVADGPPERFGTRFVAGAGYNPWAEAMNLVVLYPQVRADAGTGGTTPYRLNPKGCWDFWGYTRPLGDASLFASAPPHARRNAPQIRAVKAMVDALMRPRP
jgi:poly(3-hydroxybutyrate) depolymerase